MQLRINTSMPGEHFAEEHEIERYRALVAATTAIVWVTDAEGGFSEPQAAWTEYTGQLWPAQRGWGWLEAIHPADRATVRAQWQAALASGKTYESHGRLWHAASGAYRHYTARAAPVYDTEGNIREWIGTVSDTHEQQLARESTAQLLEISLEFAGAVTPDAIAEIVQHQCVRTLNARDGVFAMYDEGTAQLWVAPGNEPTALRAGEWSLLALDQRRPLSEAAHEQKSLFFETPERFYIHYPQLRTGPETARAWAVVPLIVDDQLRGVIMFRFGEPRDFGVSERTFILAIAQQCAQAVERMRLYEAERASRIAAERSRQQQVFLTEVLSELLAVPEYQARVARLTELLVPRLADMCSVAMVSDDGSIRTLATNCYDIATPIVYDDGAGPAPTHTQTADPAAAAIRTRRTQFYPYLRADQAASTGLALQLESPVHTAIVAPLIARDNPLGAITLGMIRPERRFSADDVALLEAVGLRSALSIDNARLYNQAQEAVRLRDAFLSLAAHELRTPLTALLGHTQLIQRRARNNPAIDERSLRSIAMIDAQGQRLAQMINALLDVSRLEAGQFQLEQRPVNFTALVERVCEELEPTLTRHEVRSQLTAAPLFVVGDEGWLEQAVQNLLQNAIKYSPEGGIVDLCLERQGTSLRLKIADQGIGIPTDALPRIYQRFYRAANVSRYQIGGIGIGLYVVREIITLHGGSIAVNSVEDQGSVFTVRLPLAGAAENREETEHE